MTETKPTYEELELELAGSKAELEKAEAEYRLLKRNRDILVDQYESFTGKKYIRKYFWGLKDKKFARLIQKNRKEAPKCKTL